MRFTNQIQWKKRDPFLYSLRIDPREKINAFYSSIITSNIKADYMQKFLQIISSADMLYGKNYENTTMETLTLS